MPSTKPPAPAEPPAAPDDGPMSPVTAGPTADRVQVERTLLHRLQAVDVALSAVVAKEWSHPRWLTLPLGVVSLTGNYGLIWILLSIVGAAAGAGFSASRFLYVTVPVVATEMITFGVKVLVRRRRPPEQEPGPEHIPLPLSPSFPSSHASMGSVGFLTMTVLYPAWWPLFLALALVLDVSRVYLRVHFLADVLVGVVLGLALGLPYIALVHV